MSVLDRLVQRARGGATPIAPLVGPNPLGPTPLAPASDESEDAPWIVPDGDAHGSLATEPARRSAIDSGPPSIATERRAAVPPAPEAGPEAATARTMVMPSTTPLAPGPSAPRPIPASSTDTPRDRPSPSESRPVPAASVESPRSAVERIERVHVHTQERIHTHERVVESRSEPSSVVPPPLRARAVPPTANVILPVPPREVAAGSDAPASPRGAPLRPLVRREPPAVVPAAAPEPPAPTMHISIGRIIVHAEPPAAAPGRAQPPAGPSPAQRLADYLDRTNGGDR